MGLFNVDEEKKRECEMFNVWLKENNYFSTLWDSPSGLFGRANYYKFRSHKRYNEFKKATMTQSEKDRIRQETADAERVRIEAEQMKYKAELELIELKKRLEEERKAERKREIDRNIKRDLTDEEFIALFDE
ncbi:MAG: hypothetical protein LBC39_07715 [Methanobrevibacter sp.]|jgi:hypothetical protein|nr:hypothetical protein [Candidatus Methanovirga aequatorialis]